MRPFAALVPLLALPSVAAVPPHPVVPRQGTAVELRLAQVRYAHQANLRQLRLTALQQQAADGGTLSPAHRHSLQERLDRENDRYRRSLVNQNPESVTRWGYARQVATAD